MIFRKTPIALLQLRYQKAQTISAALGIVFITVLLFMQIGFRSVFLDTLLELPEQYNGELFMLNASTVTILRSAEFSQRRLYQALAFDEVASARAIYTSPVTMRDPKGKPRFLRKIQAIGFTPEHGTILIPEVDQQVDKLKRGKVFLLDGLSRPEFRPVIKEVRDKGRNSIEIKAGSLQTRISIDGLFSLGANSSTDAHMFTSDVTFMEVFRRKRSKINVGLIQLKPGTDAALIKQRLNEYLPPDVAVFEKEELMAKERHHYEFNSPVGLIFRFGLAGAIIVGIVILYQILFQLISKYLKDYATLKALGYSHAMLRNIVLRESLILAILGFVPGYFGSHLVYDILSKTTALQFQMTHKTSLLVLVSICFICLISAMFAIRKLSDADPADLFG